MSSCSLNFKSLFSSFYFLDNFPNDELVFRVLFNLGEGERRKRDNMPGLEENGELDDFDTLLSLSLPLRLI